MTRLIIPFRYGITTYQLDVLHNPDMFVINGPRIITGSLGSEKFYFYKLTRDGKKTLSFSPGSELAEIISSVLLDHWKLTA